jgi:hypothetical protein
LTGEEDILLRQGYEGLFLSIKIDKNKKSAGRGVHALWREGEKINS